MRILRDSLAEGETSALIFGARSDQCRCLRWGKIAVIYVADIVDNMIDTNIGVFSLTAKAA